MRNSTTAVLRPNGFAYEASGDLPFDTIRGLSLTLRRDLDRAALIVRRRENRVGDGELRLIRATSETADEWEGNVVIYGCPWQVRAERDERAREWRVTLT